MRPWQHAKASAAREGRLWTDDLAIHEFVDSTKASLADLRHRMVLHNDDLCPTLAARAFAALPQAERVARAHARAAARSRVVLPLHVRVDSSTTYDDGYFGDFDAQRSNPALDPKLAAAIATLDRLERAGWRQWWTRAFGEWFYDNFLVLMVQDGAPWLLYATSNAGDHSSAYSLWQEHALVYFGETLERMDERLVDEPEPLQFILAADMQWQDEP